MVTAIDSRRGVARVGVLALLVGLVAFAAAPAAAVISTRNACPDWIPSAGFTDLAGVPTSAIDAIDCIVDYEISTGTSSKTFDPFTDVARWEMALFLTRQAEVHGLNLPSGADQGFTDLGGVPTAAATAINQIEQLDIANGTSATTFDPFGVVERWQMALFLTRLVDAAGLALPTGASQGFTDLVGVPSAAAAAINQVAELEISEGTGPTTFDPFSAVERWAMALFLTRTLEADGIVPEINAEFDFSPTSDIDVDHDTARTLVVSGLTPDEEYQIALIDSDEVLSFGFDVVFGDDEGTTGEADNLGDQFSGSDAITEVDGVNVTDAPEVTADADNSGEIEITIQSSEIEDFFIVAFLDSDGDEDLDLASDNTPIERYGVSGKISILADEAPDGFTNDVEVLAVDSSHFIADDGVDVLTFFYGNPDKYEYDDNSFSITRTEFNDYLSIGDLVDVAGYGQSGGTDFDITSDVMNAPIDVVATAGDFDADAGDTTDNDVEVEWDAVDTGRVATYSAELFEDDDDSGTKCWAGTSAYGPISVTDPVVVFDDVVDDAYCAVVTATSDTGYTTEESDDSTSAEVTVDSGDSTTPEIDVLDLSDDNATAGFIDSGDEITFTFSESMIGSLGSTNATFFRITDSDSEYRVECGAGGGVGDATCVLSGDDDVLTVTLDDDPSSVSGTANGLDVTDVPEVVFTSSAFDDVAGNALDLAGSTDVTID